VTAPDRANSQLLDGIARRAMLDRGLLPEFSAAALAQAEAIAAPAAATDPGMRDMRALLWASIDNDDSRDLDQLSVAQPQSGGVVRILVAIADVDALVRKESALDDHAKQNTTSVYTAAEIFPMLPEKLSTNLTSLNYESDRLAVTVEMVVANLMKNSQTAQEVIRSAVAATDPDEDCPCQHALATAIMTQPKAMRPATRAKLRLLLQKYLAKK